MALPSDDKKASQLPIANQALDGDRLLLLRTASGTSLNQQNQTAPWSVVARGVEGFLRNLKNQTLVLNAVPGTTAQEGFDVIEFRTPFGTGALALQWSGSERTLLWTPTYTGDPDTTVWRNFDGSAYGLPFDPDAVVAAGQVREFVLTTPRLFKAKRVLNPADFPGNSFQVPAPTGTPQDLNWEEVSPAVGPGGITQNYVDAQVATRARLELFTGTAQAPMLVTQGYYYYTGTGLYKRTGTTQAVATIGGAGWETVVLAGSGGLPADLLAALQAAPNPNATDRRFALLAETPTPEQLALIQALDTPVTGYLPDGSIVRYETADDALEFMPPDGVMRFNRLRYVLATNVAGAAGIVNGNYATLALAAFNLAVEQVSLFNLALEAASASNELIVSGPTAWSDGLARGGFAGTVRFIDDPQGLGYVLSLDGPDLSLATFALTTLTASVHAYGRTRLPTVLPTGLTVYIKPGSDLPNSYAASVTGGGTVIDERGGTGGAPGGSTTLPTPPAGHTGFVAPKAFLCFNLGNTQADFPASGWQADAIWFDDPFRQAAHTTELYHDQFPRQLGMIGYPGAGVARTVGSTWCRGWQVFWGSIANSFGPASLTMNVRRASDNTVLKTLTINTGSTFRHCGGADFTTPGSVLLLDQYEVCYLELVKGADNYIVVSKAVAI